MADKGFNIADSRSVTLNIPPKLTNFLVLKRVIKEMGLI